MSLWPGSVDVPTRTSMPDDGGRLDELIHPGT
jgi:hypothetical protein